MLRKVGRKPAGQTAYDVQPPSAHASAFMQPASPQAVAIDRDGASVPAHAVVTSVAAEAATQTISEAFTVVARARVSPRRAVQPASPSSLAVMVMLSEIVFPFESLTGE